ncbi:MAG: class IV adenylate cyclase [Anaerolineales bacterium]|jgi:adenylate cyclase class 2
MEYEEREIKFYLQNLEAIRERLRICGAEETRPRMLERNLRLDTADKSLQKEGRLLRLRQDDQVWVTFKANARTDGGVIARTEIEFRADDFVVVRKLFEALGYQVVVIYEKYRQVFTIGDVEVTLDELPFGHFMEIEASSNILIEGVAQMLGLDWSKGLATNYLGLFAIAKRNADLQFNDLTFDNFAGLHLDYQALEVEPADL